MSASLSAGFADPVGDAQRCFRAVLAAMSRPGSTHRIGGVTPPDGLSAASAAVALSLLDHETSLWLDSAADGAWDWLAFHCGAPRTRTLSAAGFALVSHLPDLAALHPGTHEMPETAATVICTVGSLTEGRRYRLSGPGLREPTVIAIGGLPDDFVSAWARNHARFPLGIDLILCAGDELTALARSVTIEEA